MLGKKDKSQPEPAKEPPKKAPIPTQKTFVFDDKDLSDVGKTWTSIDIDKVVNEWLHKMAVEEKTVPMLGKVAASPGKVVIIFMYSTFIEVK